MIPSDAAKLGVYAGELFRFVTDAQRTAVAEIMLPIRDLKDEYGNVVEDAVNIGQGILRTVAVATDDEQRLNLSDVSKVVHDHMREYGYAPPDPMPNPWHSQAKAVASARAADDDACSWADRLTDEQAAELTAEALKQIKPHAHYLFEKKDVRTSRVLRLLARDHYRKAHAFD